MLASYSDFCSKAELCVVLLKCTPFHVSFSALISFTTNLQKDILLFISKAFFLTAYLSHMSYRREAVIAQ